MSRFNYVIKYAAMDQLYVQMCGRIDEWNTQLEQWEEAYRKLVNMDTFQGKSAESVKLYLQEVHGFLVVMIKQTLQTYQVRYLLYKTGYYDIDENKYSSIPREALQGEKRKLQEESERLEDISRDIQRSLNSVSDIICLKNPSIEYLADALIDLRKKINLFEQNIENYEETQLTAVQGDMLGLIDSLNNAIQSYRKSGGNIADYQTGDVGKRISIVDVFVNALANVQYIDDKKEEIQIAADKQAEVYKQIQLDYEEACEAREAAGQAKMIQGGVAMLIGVAAIVGTAGMATPVVITAGVTGTCSFMYGVSSGVEGAQDWYLGSVGDLETASLNPIRDTIFAGNSEFYELWGNLNMSVAGICIPVGQAVNSVAGMGKSVIAKTAVKSIGKEVATEVIADTGSRKIAGYAQETLKLNDMQSKVLEIGLNIGISKGADSVGQRITGLGAPQLTDQMTYAEAGRYNQYWENVDSRIVIEAPEVSEIVKLSDDNLDVLQSEEYAFDAIKGNEEADKVVLGKYEGKDAGSYDVVAENIGAQYFNLDNWDEMADIYSSDDMWKINEKFLDIEISSGREIYLSHDPTIFAADGTFFSREIQYLKENGYKFIKDGELWRAVRE